MKKLFIIFVLFFTCTPAFAKDLYYSSYDFQSTPKQAFTPVSGGIYNIYNKNIEPNVNLAIGFSPSSFTNYLIMVVKIQNNSDQSFIASIDDFKIKNIEGYQVNPIPFDNYVSLRLNALNAQTSIALSNANKKAYTSTTNYSSYGNSNYLVNNNSINGYSSDYGSAKTTIEEDPWTNVANNYIKNSALKSSLGTQNLIDDLARHNIESGINVNPNTTNYFYAFFEKPISYPIILNYKNVEFTFNNKKPKKNKAVTTEAN